MVSENKNMRANEFLHLSEEPIGVAGSRAARPGVRVRPKVEMYKNIEPEVTDVDIDEEFELDERGKASRALCVSSKPDSDLGASMLASCKSQGLRARDGKKSHLIGNKRVAVGGKKIKGKKYGGPLSDYGTRKSQLS